MGHPKNIQITYCRIENKMYQKCKLQIVGKNNTQYIVNTLRESRLTNQMYRIMCIPSPISKINVY